MATFFPFIMGLVSQQTLASTISIVLFRHTDLCFPGAKGQMLPIIDTLIEGIRKDFPLLCKKIIDKDIGLLFMRRNKS